MSNIVKWAAVSDEETFAKVRVEFSFGDGSAVQKTVTMADFIRAMSTIEAEQERCLEIGQIPNGFYDGFSTSGGYLSVWSTKTGCVSGSGISI